MFPREPYQESLPEVRPRREQLSETGLSTPPEVATTWISNSVRPPCFCYRNAKVREMVASLKPQDCLTALVVKNGGLN
jgi:hypothetical protein